jgi:SAM-dependent methyltransferase
MPARISFCNDCDLMTRQGFEEVHEFLGSLGVPAGDSFWLFDPSGGDMALFTHDTQHPGPQHAWLLDQINAGTLDVLHSAGSYGERFNRGFRPTRTEIAKALDYLDREARVPRVWTNHGDVFNTQNIGGAQPAAHHRGDLPGDPAYCLDLLLACGVKYFWLDRHLSRDPAAVFRLTATETCRDGGEIVTFIRYLSPLVEWSPNAQNIAAQLRDDELGVLSENAQDTVLYIHWGCHHEGRVAVSPVPPVLDAGNRAALERFVAGSAVRNDQLVRLVPLLESSASRPPSDEVQRIGQVIVRAERGNPDQFYYNQYSRHGLAYFARRVDALGVSGRRALDAGCGVGQWSYALEPKFERVHGIEIGREPAGYLARLSAAMRSDRGPRFTRGSIEALPYRDEMFDFVLCYGVIFVTRVRVALQEFSRVLTRGGTAYICLNGDGWYEYLCDDRFKDSPADFVIRFAEPLFNALVARVGGAATFDRICRTSLAGRGPQFWTDPDRIRRTFADAFASPVVDLPRLVAEYSDRVIVSIARLVRERLDTQTARPVRPGLLTRIATRLKPSGVLALAADDCFPSAGLGSMNRPFAPGEFARVAELAGLRLSAHGADGALSPSADVRPIYDGTFNGHDAVWECILRRE